MLITTSIVSNTFSKVCFVVLSLTRRAGEKIKIGGFALNTLKKLKGDKLGSPLASMVLAKAIGLGATALNKYPCNLPVEMSFGLNDVPHFRLKTKSQEKFNELQM